LARWHNGYTTGLAINRSRVQILLKATLRNNLGQVVHTYVPHTKQYNLVPAIGRWCCPAGKATAGLAENNGSLPLGGWLTVTCRLTARRLGSAPGPMLGIEYGKPLPFLIHCFVWFCYMINLMPSYCRGSTGQPRREAANSVPRHRSPLCQDGPLGHSAHRLCRFGWCMELTFMCFQILHVPYPFELQNRYRFLEQIFSIKPSIRSTTISNLILSLSKMPEIWREWVSE